MFYPTLGWRVIKKKCGFVFKSHILLHFLTLELRVIKQEGGAQGLDSRAARFGEMMERIEVEAAGATTAAAPAQGIPQPET